ncbi:MULTISPECIES: DUF6882 domain-containing protein [unclassified Brevibacterium]|uniref:DUF6882 domain-containing protein n=1 Tax=unclassified Brevibacterium TaxID=2614124 RepID=UPI0010F4527E|nr:MULTISPECIES: DUF6882 domain-containing protein [unclassified Brevibacterium]MCM1013897.1 hypothetical protein [Brevibacterium sp. XM4083]
MSTTLQDLVNRAVFLSTEMQTHFGSVIAGAAWEVDFSADPTLTFDVEGDQPLRTRPHLVGSESSSQGTWLWGWENINGFPEAVVGLAHEVRKFGAAEGISDLVTPEIDLDDELALRLTLAAKEATGKWAHYPAAAGAGTTVWVLVDSPALALPEPTVKASVRALMQGLTQTTVDDHRAALTAYTERRGIPTAALPDGGVRMLFADGSADLSFDEQSRISNCEVHAPLEGEAADQFSRITGITVTEAAPQEPTSTAGAPAAGSPERAAAADADRSLAAAASAGTAAAASAGAAADEQTPQTTGAGAPTASTTQGVGEDVADRRSESAEPQRPSAGEPPAEEAAPAAETASPSDRPEAEAPTAAPDAQQDERAAERSAADSTTDEPKGKKKGLFSRLFGR